MPGPTLAFLREFLGDHPRDFGIRLWDGTFLGPDAGEAAFHDRLPSSGRGAGDVLASGELTLSEAFLFDDFDVEGDLEAVFPIADELLGRDAGVAERLRLLRRLLTLPSERRHGSAGSAHTSRPALSLERDRQAIAYHYDLSNDFFALWLDPTMAYSCAVFDVVRRRSRAAQRRKLDYVCRKLRLRPGERLLDIGCGWGGLVMHAARNYGVEALGVTLSRGAGRARVDADTEAGLETGAASNCATTAR